MMSTPSSGSSISTLHSFHTASEGSPRSTSDDEIPTIIGTSSDSSEIHSLVLGQRSRYRGDSTTISASRESRVDSREGSESLNYSTARSSIDSRYESESFYTATSDSKTSQSRARDESFYSDQFESEQSSHYSQTESKTEQEFSDEEDAEKHFMRSVLRVLRRPQKEQPESDADVARKVPVDQAEEDEFVKTHIHALRQKRVTGSGCSKRAGRKRSSWKSRCTSLSEVVVSRGIVEKLRIENLLHDMRKFSEEPIHEPSNCASCRLLQEEVREKDFAREKRRLAYNKLTEEKYMQHLVTRDPLNEIGSLAAALPKASDDPQKIWDQLLQKGIT